MALVSIIIPCHNAAPWLAQTVESALNQVHRPTEVILIDDGSTDDSVAIAQKYADWIAIATQPNRGASAARNHGLRLARGEFIQFLDADDLLTPDKIAAQIAVLTGSEATGCVASCRWGRFDQDPALARFVDTGVFQDFAPIEYLILHATDGKMMHPGAWLIPAELAKAAGPWDETLTLNDDGEYFARVVLHARRILHSRSGASLYRSGLTGSLSRSRSREALESLHHSGVLISQSLQQAEDSTRIQAALAAYWRRLGFELYPDAPDLSRDAMRRSKILGGANIPPPWSGSQRLLARFVGWKLARRLARLFGR